MEKLNIAEILKDCPSGIKLYSTVHGEVELVDIYHDLIRCKFSYGITFVSFHSDGRWIEHRGECVLFPSKDQRDWSKFHRPFKDGDILTYMFWNKPTVYIYRKSGGYNTSYYAAYSSENKRFYYIQTGALAGNRNDLRFATEEEKQQLFDAIEENGYKWNSETKTLEKLIEPKFKVGDKIQNRMVKTNNVYTIVGIKDLKYFVNMNNEKHNYEIDFEVQDDWELAPHKFDIATLKPFDKVLVRQSDTDYWKPAFWGKRITSKSYPFITSFGHTTQAIPFKGNEWLVGTTEDCKDYYKTWI